MKKIIIAAIAGTTFMTLFSEIVSKLDGNEYNEAEILGKLLDRISPLDKDRAKIAGSIGHYGVGVVFAGLYNLYLSKSRSRPTIVNGFIFGALSGLAGAAVWHTTFKAHPNPPGVYLKNFYKQLIVAHAIFGVAASLTYSTKECSLGQSSAGSLSV